MFIQVIKARTDDRDGLRRQFDSWKNDVKPGAKGYLGTTGGVADDGTVVMLARFESADAARQNSERDQQSSWWNETSKYLSGVEFHDCTEVDTAMGGGSNDAGFLQLIMGRCTNKERARELNAQAEGMLAPHRPDVIGTLTAWDGDWSCDAIYFSSEKAAREGEASMADAPEDVRKLYEEMPSLYADVTFVDVKQPYLD